MITSTQPNSWDLIQPGDHLIYNSMKDLVDWGIMLKTGSPACHIEICIAPGKAVAARNGIGVDDYPLRKEGLAWILRPKSPLDITSGLEWFYRSAHGQKYGWAELFNFWLPFSDLPSDGMICSTFAAFFGDACGFEAFNQNYDHNKISPADYTKSGAFDWVWTKFPTKTQKARRDKSAGL